MRGFGLDGKFFRGLTKAGDFLILGLITVIFCIPVITIGASLTAAFYAGMKLVKDEENYVFKDFWKFFYIHLQCFQDMMIKHLQLLRIHLYYAFITCHRHLS